MRESPNTYFVQDRRNRRDELTRLTIQDRIVTAMMGGVLPEQADPTNFRHVLDVACGTGGWIVKAAQTYPQMSLVGIDIGQQMIKYARAQAKADLVHSRVEFYVMDALQTLDFPAASFDLVNLRFGISFVRTWDWRQMLGELLRVTCPGGIIRIIDSDLIFQSNSPALTQLCEMILCAFFRAGHIFEQASTGLIAHLPRLLNQYGCQQVQTRVHPIEYRAGTPEGEAFYTNLKLAFQTIRPFIEKWGCATRDYEAIYRQAFREVSQADFLITVNMLTAWGYRP